MSQGYTADEVVLFKHELSALGHFLYQVEIACSFDRGMKSPQTFILIMAIIDWLCMLIATFYDYWRSKNA